MGDRGQPRATRKREKSPGDTEQVPGHRWEVSSPHTRNWGVGSPWPPGREQGAPRVRPQRILQVVHGLLVNGAPAVVDQGAGEQHGQHEDPRVVLGVALEQRPQVLTLSSSPMQDPFRHEPECPEPECCQPASHGKTIPWGDPTASPGLPTSLYPQLFHSQAPTTCSPSSPVLLGCHLPGKQKNLAARSPRQPSPHSPGFLPHGFSSGSSRGSFLEGTKPGNAREVPASPPPSQCLPAPRCPAAPACVRACRGEARTTSRFLWCAPARWNPGRNLGVQRA